MATNHNTDTDRLTLTAAAAVTGGAFFIVDTHLGGIVAADADAGEVFTLYTKGKGYLAKGQSGTAFGIGKPAYWDNVNDVVLSYAGGPRIGHFTDDAGASDEKCWVQLDGRLDWSEIVAEYDSTATGMATVGTHSFGPKLPDGAIVQPKWVKTLTGAGFTSGGSATVAFGVETDGATGILSATAVGSMPSAGARAAATSTAPTAYIATTAADRRLLATIATAALTGGKARVCVGVHFGGA